MFLTLLDTLAREGRDVSHKPRAGNYAPRQFAKRPDRFEYGVADFEKAMERLFHRKAIAIETYKRNSKDHECIARSRPEG